MTSVTRSGSSGEVFDPWLASHKWNVSSLRFSFPTDGSFYSYQSKSAVSELTDAQKDAVRQVLTEIAGFTGLSFREVFETQFQEATLRFAQETGLSGAYAYLPASVEEGGDVFFGFGALNPVPGNEGYLFYIHEIGHVMGLEHGHEAPAFVKSGLDSQEYTVVTYSDYVGDPDPDSFDSGPVDWAQSYQQLDIAAMQFLYGANFSSTGEVWSGDTVYAFNPNTGEMSINGAGQGAPAGNRIFRTIWDGHGEDTYDLSAYATDLQIDLAPGAWSTFSVAQLADLDRFSTDPARIAAGNVANARLYQGDERSLIENVIGGDGDDAITGNQADNDLRGNAGQDKLKGLSGDDGLFGGLENDKLIGGRGHDLLQGGMGDDLLKGGGGKDVLEGGLGFDRLKGGGGKDVFLFTDMNDSLAGQKIDRIFDFEVGKDKLDLSLLIDEPFDFTAGRGPKGQGPTVGTKEKGGANTVVLADLDGDGVTDLKVLVLDTLGLTDTDFLL